MEKHQGIFTKNALTRLDGSKHDNKTQWACNGETNEREHTHAQQNKKYDSHANRVHAKMVRRRERVCASEGEIV